MPKEGEQHFEGKVAQKAIIYSPTGRVLICRNNWDENTWDLPGGIFNTDETPEVGILREVKEELGVEPTNLKPFIVSSFVKQKTGTFTFLVIYTAELPQEDPCTFHDGEIAEVRWIAQKDIAALKFFSGYAEALEEFFVKK